MASSQNPMAYLLENGLRRVESERPELSNDSRYLELEEQLLRDAEGHFREIQATYATILKTQCHCGGQLEPVDHDFGKSGGTIYDSVLDLAQTGLVTIILDMQLFQKIAMLIKVKRQDSIWG